MTGKAVYISKLITFLMKANFHVISFNFLLYKHNSIIIRDRVGQRHHVFPRDYLKKSGLTRGDYNQIANYVYMQSEINIKVGNKAPKDYFDGIAAQCSGGRIQYGAISGMDALKENLRMNCIPETISEMKLVDYEEFLKQRRVLMAEKMRLYYLAL